MNQRVLPEDYLAYLEANHQDLSPSQKEACEVLYARRKALEAADAALKSLTCPKCHGDGVVDYPDLSENGSGENLIHATCPACNGTGINRAAV